MNRETNESPRPPKLRVRTGLRAGTVISETALKHEGYKKGTQNTLDLGGAQITDEGHNR